MLQATSSDVKNSDTCDDSGATPTSDGVIEYMIVENSVEDAGEYQVDGDSHDEGVGRYFR